MAQNTAGFARRTTHDMRRLTIDSTPQEHTPRRRFQDILIGTPCNVELQQGHIARLKTGKGFGARGSSVQVDNPLRGLQQRTTFMPI